jgi:GlcNAc-P-P-Und epimerase
MRVMVTGSSGFIGSHLVVALINAGFEVHGLDNRAPGSSPGWTHHDCDLLDAARLQNVLSAVRPDVLVHLAARIDLDEKHDIGGYASNTTGVENLLSAVTAVPSIRRCVVTSTQLVCKVGYTPVHDLDYAPSTLYGESKIRTEKVWRDANGAGRTWCITRPTTIWGAGMNTHYLTFFRMVRDGRYFHIGDGATPKSYGYVGNAVHQYVRLIDAPTAAVHARTFYVADYEPVHLRDWAECFRRELGGPPIRSIPKLLARAAAFTGDALNTVGYKTFPFNSFRLNNVLTASTVPVENTRRVCGPLPFTMQAGVRDTAVWIRRALDAADHEGRGAPGSAPTPAVARRATSAP